ncbi:MAG: polysaccharide deacetylase family protein [Candidatus Binatia bacterium]
MKNRPKIAVLFVARTLGMFALSRYLTRDHLRILCYHGGAIGDESGYNPKLFCSADTLRSRMNRLKSQGFNFVTLNDGLEQQGRSGRKDPLRVVVTFDDGWHSTASTLLPVMFQMKIPSTLYLSTQNFLEGWPILNVTVRYIIWKAELPSVTIQGWGPDLDGEYQLGLAKERHRLASRTVKAIQESASERDQVCAALERFAASLGVPVTELKLDSRRFDYVSKQELINIAHRGCSIELHGHVHEYPKGNAVQLAEDLRMCERTIVGLGLAPPQHYCYPSGSFDLEASEALGRLGIRSATTCMPGFATKIDGNRRHYLPRFLDGEDVHALEFEAETSGFSELIRSFVHSLRRSQPSFSPVPPEAELIPADI